MKRVLGALSLVLVATLMFFVGDKTTRGEQKPTTLSLTPGQKGEACPFPSENRNEMFFLGCGGYLD